MKNNIIIFRYFSLIFLGICVSFVEGKINSLGINARKYKGIKSNNVSSTTAVHSNQWSSCLIYCRSQTSFSCNVVNFSPSSGSCSIINSNGYMLVEDSTWDLYIIDESLQQWEKIFQAASGTGHNIYTAWNGTYTGLTTYSNSSTNSLFRSPLIDVWDKLGIKKVKVELSTSKLRVAYLTFDAYGSTSLTWFSQGRLVESSWKQLKPMTETTTFEGFDIVGSYSHGRAFVVFQYYAGCSGDLTYMAVVDNHARGLCVFDTEPFPAFLYSTSDAGMIFDTQGYGKADQLTVYIYRE